MPFTNLDPDAVAVKVAGLLGAAISMRFLQGTWPVRAATALSGAVLSYYAAPFLSHKIGMPEGLAGFLLGMFGMAVVSRAWEAIQETPIGPIWQAALDRIRGRKEDSRG